MNKTELIAAVAEGVGVSEGHRAGIERLFQHGAGDLETERQGTDPWLLAALKCVSVPPARATRTPARRSRSPRQRCLRSNLKGSEGRHPVKHSALTEFHL